MDDGFYVCELFREASAVTVDFPRLTFDQVLSVARRRVHPTGDPMPSIKVFGVTGDLVATEKDFAAPSPRETFFAKLRKWFGRVR